jgi:hypothetical protein|tara:strand:- start:7808 stop:8212 length:405 start_codon:yes stop_codon:yes gene_type:complete
LLASVADKLDTVGSIWYNVYEIDYGSSKEGDDMNLRRQLGGDYNRCLDDSHRTYPSAYDREMDPDPQIADLETKVERLSQSFARWARHLDKCPARLFGSDPDSCRCGLQQERDGSLWAAGDHSDLTKALSFLED